MSTAKLLKIARAGALVAGVVIVACIGILLGDYLVASVQRPQDDQRIKATQKQVEIDAALSPALAADQKAVTLKRLARKRRDNLIAYVLIAASALFLICSKRLLRQRGRAVMVCGPRSEVRGQEPRRPATDHGPRTTDHGPRTTDPVPDLRFVDEIVAKEGRGTDAAITLLQAIQSHYRYLPDEALLRLCELTDITPAQVAGTSSFYGQFRRSPVGKHVIRVCHGTACHVAGARQITEELRRHLAIPDGADTDPQRMFTLDEVACLGCCSLAPVLMVDGQTAGRLTPSAACAALKPFEQADAREETA
jgi:NADH:ubiquinone oxidoreductase subunit E